MHTYESLDLNELRAFMIRMKPDAWQISTRIDPGTLRTVYVLEWFRLKTE